MIINLTIHGEAPQRILFGEGFQPCQENRKSIIVDDLPDAHRFIKILEDSNLNPDAETPTYTIKKYETTAEALTVLKRSVKDLINGTRNAACVAPITIEVGGVATTFNADNTAQNDISRAYLKALKVGDTFTIDWVDFDNNVVTLNQQDVFNLGDAIGDRRATEVYTANTKKVAVDALTTITKVKNYTI